VALSRRVETVVEQCIDEVGGRGASRGCVVRDRARLDHRLRFPDLPGRPHRRQRDHQPGLGVRRGAIVSSRLPQIGSARGAITRGLASSAACRFVHTRAVNLSAALLYLEDCYTRLVALFRAAAADRQSIVVWMA
jgi:hypothetical protein